MNNNLLAVNIACFKSTGCAIIVSPFLKSCDYFQSRPADGSKTTVKPEHVTGQVHAAR